MSASRAVAPLSPQQFPPVPHSPQPDEEKGAAPGPGAGAGAGVGASGVWGASSPTDAASVQRRRPQQQPAHPRKPRASYFSARDRELLALQKRKRTRCRCYCFPGVEFANHNKTHVSVGDGTMVMNLNLLSVNLFLCAALAGVIFTPKPYVWWMIAPTVVALCVLFIAAIRYVMYGAPDDPVFAGSWVNGMLGFEADEAVLMRPLRRQELAAQAARARGSKLDVDYKRPKKGDLAASCRAAVGSMLVDQIAPYYFPLVWLLTYVLTMVCIGAFHVLYQDRDADNSLYRHSKCKDRDDPCQVFGEMVLVTATAQCFIGAFVTLAASFQSSRQQMERLFHKIEELQETVPAITFLVELLHAHLHDAHPAVFRKIVVEKLDAAEAAEAQRQTKKRGSCFRLLCGCCELLQRLCSRGAKSLEVYVLKDDNEEEPDEDGPHVGPVSLDTATAGVFSIIDVIIKMGLPMRVFIAFCLTFFPLAMEPVRDEAGTPDVFANVGPALIAFPIALMALHTIVYLARAFRVAVTMARFASSPIVLSMLLVDQRLSRPELRNSDCMHAVADGDADADTDADAFPPILQDFMPDENTNMWKVFERRKNVLNQNCRNLNELHPANWWLFRSFVTDFIKARLDMFQHALAALLLSVVLGVGLAIVWVWVQGPVLASGPLLLSSVASQTIATLFLMRCIAVVASVHTTRLADATAIEESRVFASMVIEEHNGDSTDKVVRRARIFANVFADHALTLIQTDDVPRVLGFAVTPALLKALVGYLFMGASSLLAKVAV